MINREIFAPNMNDDRNNIKAVSLKTRWAIPIFARKELVNNCTKGCDCSEEEKLQGNNLETQGISKEQDCVCYKIVYAVEEFLSIDLGGGTY